MMVRIRPEELVIEHEKDVSFPKYYLTQKGFIENRELDDDIAIKVNVLETFIRSIIRNFVKKEPLK